MTATSATRLLARCDFPPPGTAVSCAVSGGADSTALLVLAVEAGCRATAMHVDHGLRPGSAAEAEVVARSAARLGATFLALRADIRPGPNLEARARAARYAQLPAGVLTGHTADDLAETMVINLLRGAGVDGLSAMARRRAERPHRPLLGLRRAETAGLCAELGLTTVDDPSNHDPVHVRNRVRRDLLPLMSAIAGRDVIPILARQAGVMAGEAETLDDLAATLEPTDARALAGAPNAVARRAVRRWLSAEHPPDLATVERVLAVARGKALATDIGGGESVRRTHQRLRRLTVGDGPVAWRPE